jgi:hypothetical protein
MLSLQLSSWESINSAESTFKSILFVMSVHVMRVNCRSGFATLPPVPLQEQPAVVLLLEGVLVSWSLAMDERGGREDLRSSDRQSVIPYVHGRTELYCSSLYEPEPFFPDPCEEVSTRSFYTSRPGSYNETRGPTAGPEVVETPYNI